MGSCLSTDGTNPHPYSPTFPSGGRKHRKKKGLRSSSSFDSRRSEQLSRTPGRLYSNGASNAASLFTQQGKKGTNQDAMIVWENFGSRTDTVFCGVFDGHGPYGHMVARRVRDSLPLKLSSHWEVNIGGDDGSRQNSISGMEGVIAEENTPLCEDEESRGSMDIEDKDKYPEIYLTLKESFLKAFNVMDKELKMHPTLDCFCSGTTAVTLVKQGQDLIIGNVGDSRAILGTRDRDDSLIAVQLTVDLKPNLPREAERIKQCRGRVFALQDEPEVSRIWLPNNDSPGLAMARAFGDFCLKDFGLISVPEVFYRRLTEKDEFLVLATDGVWDVLTNQEVVDIVASAPTQSAASHALVESAVRAWRSKYPTSKVDDCAVVCLFLKSSPTNNSPTSKENQPALEDLLSMGPVELNRSGTVVRACPEIQPDEDEENADLVEQPNWSALEGVSRVNTLLTLPRYVPGKDGKPSISKSRK
ncbi:probable protein phosphatase 2C 33 [Papaver somniferum]|uniref:probable protein phosphatase 2C 33 n=1 Tax=Papaver somniferum TaxID=3469 RepID=UPI000E6F8803|nr:probable protein phosphatase 2C 33 [Papaver somniferum]